jgi:hypothetical protein
MSNLEPNPIRKIGFDLLTLVDMDAAVEELRILWYGSTETYRPLTFADYGKVLFTVMRPRPGALGVLRDLVAEGCSLHFFCDFTDDTVGLRAEEWLQTWTGLRELALHQIRSSQSPVQLDCQVYVLAEGHGYTIPEGRPRVGEHPLGGEFDRSLVAKLREFTVAKKAVAAGARAK